MSRIFLKSATRRTHISRMIVRDMVAGLFTKAEPVRTRKMARKIARKAAKKK